MSKISFHINGIRYEVDGRVGPEMSLNDYIRNVADLRGTKVMCREGDCGICIVAVSAPMPPNHVVKKFSVNSCLVSVLSCHGWEVTTVEGIGNRTIGYHPIQTRLAKFNGTQCGFCTSGWIMNMYSLYISGKNMTSQEIENSFASNSCRCTGYRSIADAFKSFAVDADKTLIDKVVDLEDLGMLKLCGVNCASTCRHKKCTKQEVLDDFTFIMDDKMLTIEHESGNRWYRAYTLKDVFTAMSFGEYMLISGNTGQGPYPVTTYPPIVIDIFNVSELKGYFLDVNLVLGAGMVLSDMITLFQALSSEKEEFSYLEDICNHMELVGHIPVTTIGSIGGNLFLKYLHNEFPSDVFLLFETVGAMITIARGIGETLVVTLPDFLRMDMSGKIILNILLPPLSKYCYVKTYKIMPRSQNATAIVNAGFFFQFRENSNLLYKATIVYGGISPTFIHARKTEAILVGKDPYTDETLKMVLESLAQETVPNEDPPKPSAQYRKMLAINLYYKAILSLCPDQRLNPKYRSGGEAIMRNSSMGSQSFETDKKVWPVNQPVPKLEALAQCCGEATFANDLPAQINEVFAAFVTADVIPGSEIDSFDISEAKNMPGFVTFYSAKDIPGENNFTPEYPGVYEHVEEILCKKEVKFYGQPAGIVVADTEDIANTAAKLITVKYSKISNEKPLLNIENVLSSPYKDKRVKHDATVEPTETGDDVKQVIYGEMNMGSQYHYHMETQTCVAKPTEDGMEVYSSTQWHSLTHQAIARCLNVSQNYINIIVRRVGGAYGAKISRSIQIACSAALVSHLLGRTCRFILPLMINMKAIGKRIATSCKYEVGVNNDGVIQYLKNEIYQDVGHSFNEAITFLTIQAFHNSYEYKRWKVSTNSVTTDTPSNTACRAPYTTEGVAMIEHVMENIAYHTGKNSIDVRLSNISKEPNNPIPEMITQLKKDANYEDREIAIAVFNESNRWRKRSIRLMPLSFDIMYQGNYNAIISIYSGDGTIAITHGGTELGQGINTKAAQVCAYKLGVPLEKISVKPSATLTSPNVSGTWGSIGSDCVALAVIKACEILNKRLEPFKKEKSKWEDIIAAAHKAEVDLQASYMVAAKKDKLTTYYVYAVGILEIEVDILTGNYDVLRVDILEDTGRSLSPEIDVGQIEGAFIMGLGYWTSEKLLYDKSTGKLLTNSAWLYKIPGLKDIPADFRIYFRKGSRNEAGVLQSKATGEPALCLAALFPHAAREAVRCARLDAGYKDTWFDIENPCTVENIFMAVGHQLEHLTLK